MGNENSMVNLGDIRMFNLHEELARAIEIVACAHGGVLDKRYVINIHNDNNYYNNYGVTTCTQDIK